LYITKIHCETQRKLENTHKQIQQQEAPSLSETLEENKPPPEAAREGHVPSRKTPQLQNNGHQLSPTTTNHDLTRWRDPHAPIPGERSPHVQTTRRQERTTKPPT
jgi:hypothetical protein